jgi:hypothetical protein
MLLAMTPLPMPLITPPVTRMYFMAGAAREDRKRLARTPEKRIHQHLYHFHKNFNEKQKLDQKIMGPSRHLRHWNREWWSGSPALLTLFQQKKGTSKVV